MMQYSIDQFSKVTGLNKILIRTWENRYGFINPKRTSTNIRYYDDNMLTLGIKYSILVENDYKISKLIKLKETQINDLIENILESNKDISTSNKIYISKFIQSSLALDQNLFNQTYKQCVKSMGLINFYKNVLIKTMNKIAALWLSSKINPANEHFFSENIRLKLASEIEKTKTKEQSDEKWVLFLPENEFHDIGLLFSNLILKKNGYSTIYLGQNLPRESLLSLKEDTTNMLFFITANKTSNYINELILFMQKNFKKSLIYIITKKFESNKNKRIKHISNIDEFLNVLRLKKNETKIMS